MGHQKMSQEKIKPQPGKQTDFLSSKAHIVIYGGQAGGGKSFGLLLEAVRHYYNPKFNSMIFRRTTKQLTVVGGMWDKACETYIKIGGFPNQTALKVRFPTGMQIQFSHMEHEKDKYSYQGSELPFIGFDELTQFTESMFWYMLSRNRSVSGVPGRVFATCNPDPDSWVLDLIGWWIDENGMAIEERCGKLRWFIRLNNELKWANSKQELLDQYPCSRPKSLTFINASIHDNKILMDKDPEYLASLEALPLIDRMALLEGNWKYRKEGNFFKRDWWEIIEPDKLPPNRKTIRHWDMAATDEAEGKKSALTAGGKVSRDEGGTFYVEDMICEQYSAGKVKTLIKNTASQDGPRCVVGLKQDPGQAGKAQFHDYVTWLVGYEIHKEIETGSKEVRAKPVSAQAEHGKVKLVRGEWNESFIEDAAAFPNGPKDKIDAVSGAFSYFMQNPVIPVVAPPSMTCTSKWSKV